MAIRSTIFELNASCNSRGFSSYYHYATAHAYLIGHLQSCDTLSFDAMVQNQISFGESGTIAGSQFANVTGLDRVVLSEGMDSFTLSNAMVENARSGLITVVNTGGSDFIDASQVTDPALSVQVLGSAHGEEVIGSSGHDTLKGNGGNDQLDGGPGADFLDGGAGNDTFVVDQTGDTIVDSSGVDTVSSSIHFNLTGIPIENLVLTGSTDLNGTGNSLANMLTGNDGRNHLSGLDGDDSLAGGRGDDTLYGGQGADRLNGGENADFLSGGLGDDLYIVDNVGDVIDETGPLSDTDTVESSVSFDLTGEPLENLTLTGTSDINGTGNSLANVLTGNSGDNLLSGKGGDDTYIIQNAGDAIDETGPLSDIDTVRSSVGFDLTGEPLDNLTLTGDMDIGGTGNSLDNVIRGNAGDNLLMAQAGDDTVHGSEGKDRLIGGIGQDQFVFSAVGHIGNSVSTRDAIFDFAQGADLIDFSGIDAIAATGPDDAFAFIGASAFSGTAGELRAATSGAHTHVQGDVDGDATADFDLVVIGLLALGAGDFIL